MSEASPPEKKNARKRGATESAEELETSSGSKRSGRGAIAAKRTSKNLEVEGEASAPSSPSPKPQDGHKETMEVDNANDTSTTSEPTSKATESSTTQAKKASSATTSAANKDKSAAEASQAPTKSSAPAARTSKSAAPSSDANGDAGDLESEITEKYSTMPTRRFIPFRGKKMPFSSSSLSNPTDFDLADTIRDVTDIVEESAVSEVLEVVFSSCDTVATSRPNFIHEVYKIMSI